MRSVREQTWLEFGVVKRGSGFWAASETLRLVARRIPGLEIPSQEGTWLSSRLSRLPGSPPSRLPCCVVDQRVRLRAGNGLT